MGEVNGYSKSIELENIFKKFYGKRKNKAKMQNSLSKFHRIHFSPLILLSFIQVLYVSNLFN